MLKDTHARVQVRGSSMGGGALGRCCPCLLSRANTAVILSFSFYTRCLSRA